MPRWIILLLTVPPWISLAGAWLASGCAESPTTYRGDAAPHVVELGGCDLTDAGVEELLVRLDRPFANDDEIGEMTISPPVEIDPMLPVTGQWLDERSLLINLLQAPDPQADYSLRFTDRLGDALAPNDTHRFTAAELRSLIDGPSTSL